MRFFLLLIPFLALLAPALAFAQKTETQAKIDSLQMVIATTKEDTTKARSLCELCWQLRIAGQMDAALEKGEAGLELARAAGDRKAEGGCLNSIGIIYDDQGDYARALDYSQQSLKIYEETGDRNGQAISLINIGGIYWSLGDYARALDYYQKGLKIYEETGDRSGQGMALGNIGGIYYSQGAYARALDYYQQSLKIEEQTGDRSGQAASLGNIGFIYSQQGGYARALDYYQQSLEIFEEIGAPSGQAKSLTNIASLKAKTGRAAEGRRIAGQALDLATEIGIMDYMRLAAEVHTQADSALGNWKSAYEHYKLYKKYSDSLNNESQSKEIGRLEAKYEFDKEIEERERQEAEAAERRQMLYWIAAGIFTALLLVAGLLTWGFQTKQKANKQLALQNAEIKQQSEEISQQRDELQALNDQITEQRDVLEKAHEEITDSIDYASRIQHALLPSVEAMRQNAEVYVYYNARDVVSGDFYWTHRIDEDAALYSAAD